MLERLEIPLKVLIRGSSVSFSATRPPQEIIRIISNRTAPPPQAFFDALMPSPESRDTLFAGSVKGAKLRLYEPLRARRRAGRWVSPTFFGEISGTETGSQIRGKIHMRRGWSTFYAVFFVGVWLSGRHFGYAWFAYTFDIAFGLTLLVGFLQLAGAIDELEERIRWCASPPARRSD